eukprot:CAMPEP_0206277102 /NCGR_PEP_ID=MMETSP0047_2-20121206/36679_1 /ASSEMBLY_ACC=CAM_ASM_000192 /TAXON_ID=195065 /ORGANISM="Chroomonas mesostigmatica_cf, Strain CCMP1168" /LENGTH=97 /DNA_ID=CAMNT_0053706701 /DNA_START=183 /DNA_END=476 /DNA_ORIENTATION=+
MGLGAAAALREPGGRPIGAVLGQERGVWREPLNVLPRRHAVVCARSGLDEVLGGRGEAPHGALHDRAAAEVPGVGPGAHPEHREEAAPHAWCYLHKS